MQFCPLWAAEHSVNTTSAILSASSTTDLTNMYKNMITLVIETGLVVCFSASGVGGTETKKNKICVNNVCFNVFFYQSVPKIR